MSTTNVRSLVGYLSDVIPEVFSLRPHGERGLNIKILIPRLELDPCAILVPNSVLVLYVVLILNTINAMFSFRITYNIHTICRITV